MTGQPPITTSTERSTQAAATASLPINFYTIRQLAKPGSWRRGYLYYRTKHITDMTPITCETGTGVSAQVKGSGQYEDYYETQVTYSADHDFRVSCTCPLEEVWCKHAVSLGLTAIRAGVWSGAYSSEALDSTTESVTREPVDGLYRFAFRQAANGRGFQLHITPINKAPIAPIASEQLDSPELDAPEFLRQLEPVLRAAVLLSKEDPQAFTDADKRDLRLLQQILKNVKTDEADPEGWFDLPLKAADDILPLLQQLPVCYGENQQPIVHAADPLTLRMGLNVSMAGNVLISLYWIRQQPTIDIYPLEEIFVFGRDSQQAYYDNTWYPLSHKLKDLPSHITRHSFTDIRDSEGGKFMYEVLPGIRKILDIDESEIIDRLYLDKHAPTPVVTLEEVDDATQKIRLALEFDYDTQRVTFSKTAPDSPYIMVIKPETDTIYWMRRDPKLEKAVCKQLVDLGFEHLQTHLLGAEGDAAIDALHQLKPHGEQHHWTLIGLDDLTHLAVAEHLLLIVAHTRFEQEASDGSVSDSFILAFNAACAEHTLTLNQVQDALISGRKYLYLPTAGYAELPLVAYLQTGKTITAFDPELLEADDTYRVKTFKAGLLKELLDVGVSLAPSQRFAEFWTRITSFRELADLPVPEGVHADLRSYQKQGFNWLWFLYSYGLNGVLADDMGLGKTLQTLTLFEYARQQGGTQPNLVICPTSVVFNWIEETRRFLPHFKILNLTGATRHTLYKTIHQYDLVITSYTIMRRDMSALKNYPFRTVVLDEAQHIKNSDSQTAQAAKLVNSAHRFALSGTPIENRLSELWSLFDFLMPTFLQDAPDFRQRYILPIEEHNNRDAERRLKQQISPFILRRMKRDVAKELPPKIESIAYCELTDAQQAQYLSMLEAAQSQLAQPGTPKAGGKGVMTMFTALTRLRQICCHPALVDTDLPTLPEASGKLEALMEMLEEVIAEGHRVLVFSQFVEMLKIIRKALDKAAIKYEYLTGETPAEERQASVNRFNNTLDSAVFLISLKAGGTGLNLTGADYVIHYDPWWNPAAEEQATDRAYRIGQDKTVMVYRFITRGTVEEKMMRIKARKQDLMDSIISANRSIESVLTAEDLRDMLTPDF
jgi:superfamily II DNA or RNA helicase